MSDPTSIFDDKNSASPDANKAPNSNGGDANQDTELATLLIGIKNERGEPKYKNLKDALVALQNSQTYIPELKTSLTAKEQEIERLRAEAARITELEETVRKLTEKPNTSGTPPAGTSPQEIAELVKNTLNSTLTAREQAAVASQNIAATVAALKSQFGDKAEEMFNAKASELGMTVAEFNALTAKSPKIVLTALGITDTKQLPTFNPTTGNVNTSALKPTAETHIGRNKIPTLVGATTQDLQGESLRANKMVEELHSAGRSVHELTDPKQYFKHFG